jgi:hypothetical protein
MDTNTNIQIINFDAYRFGKFKFPDIMFSPLTAPRTFAPAWEELGPETVVAQGPGPGSDHQHQLTSVHERRIQIRRWLRVFGRVVL